MATQLLSPAAAGRRTAIDVDGAFGAARLGWIAAFLFFGAFMAWAAMVRLDAAAHAAGAITVAGNRRAVQHKDGGAVRAIHVHEGQRVRAGDVLIELAVPEVAANERALAAQAIRLEAERARLIAERSGGAIAMPTEFAAFTGEDREEAERALALQRALMASRRQAIGDQKRVLASQAGQLGEQVAGTTARMRFTGDQDRLYDDELRGMETLAEQGYVSRNRVRDLERQRAEIGGQQAGLVSSAAATRQEVGEKRIQALTIESQFAEKVSTDLRDTEATLGEVLPKWRAARAALDATYIRATATGRVVGLQVFTVGGVIEPGQKLMEIVPDEAPLVVEAQLSPDDADEVHAGLPVEVRVTALHDRGAAPLAGVVQRLSADALHDEKSGRSYYTLTATVPPASVAALQRREGRADVLRPGLPVEVLVTLHPRTMLDYLIEPFRQATWRAMREH